MSGITRRLGAGVGASIVATSLVVVQGAPGAAAPPERPARTPIERVASRPDVLSASVSARAQGSRVEVESLRDETSTTWVNPDGTFTTDTHAAPVRFRSGGRWRDVDLRLETAADGSVAPRGHAHGLRLSGGAPAAAGSAPLATVAAGAGREVALHWPGGLPAPSVDGTRATYRDVTPGVDAIVESLRTGYEQLFVVKERPAGPVSWRLPLLTKGLSARTEPDGSVSFVDGRGAVASRFAPAIAWDAAVHPVSGEHLNVAPVAMSVAQAGAGRAVLTITPDAGWLADPARQFPVTVDPTYAAVTVYPSYDAFVQEGYSSDQSGATELKLGTYDGSTVARSFINFPTSAFRGKRIMSASLSLFATHSYSCSARNWQVWNASTASTATRWTAQPTWASLQATTSVTKGYSSSCPDARVSVTLTSLITAWAAGSGTTGTLGLKAENEGDIYGWKRFSSAETTNDPYLSITYDRAPGTAATPTLTPVATYNSTSYTSDTTPQFTSKSTDADGNTVKIKFEVHNSTTTSSTSLKSSCTTSAYVASAANTSCSPTTALADNATYYVRALAFDGYLWSTAWSPWKSFKMAAAAPAAPAITCPPPYTNGSWTDQPPAANVSCTVAVPGSGTTAPVKALISIDGGPETAYSVTPGATAQVSVSVSNAAGGHSVKARAQSASVMNSAYSTYTFGYGQAALTSPASNSTSANRFRVTASAPPKGVATSITAKLQWRLAGSGNNESTGWTDDPVAVPVTDNGLSGVSSTLLWDATGASAAAVGSDRLPALLDVQICYTYSYATGSTTRQCTWSTSPTSVQHVPHAFGHGFPTAAAGPGQVALWTGEFNLEATDVSVPGYSGSLSISRSHSTFAGPDDVVTGVFGPGWSAQLEGPDDGAAGVRVVDNTAKDGTIVLVDSDGSVLVYRQPGDTKVQEKTGRYTPVGADTELAGMKLELSGTAPAFTLALTEDDGTVTTWKPVSYTAGVTTTWKPDGVSEPGQVGRTTYSHDSAGRVTRILAAVPPVPGGQTPVSCPATGPLNPGCRALRIGYAGTTTATATADGDVAGQVKQIWLDIYNPAKAGGAGMEEILVASYQYDGNRRLVRVTEPRSGRSTGYGYDGTSTRLASVTPAGLAAFRFGYETAANPDPAGRSHVDWLKHVSRDPARATEPARTVGSFVYDLDPATTAPGLPDLTAATTAIWSQAKPPTYGAAAFSAERPASSTYPAAVAAADWPYASLSYTDALGYTVNTAGYGAGAWQLSATDYDARGNVVRTLDAGAITRIRAESENLPAGETLDADPYATITRYNAAITNGAGEVVTAAGMFVVDTWEPARWVVLADGTKEWARPHTHTDYDQGAPNSGINPGTDLPYRLPTRVTTGVAPAEGATSDPAATIPADLETLSVTASGYDPIDGSSSTGPTSGWTLGAATTSTKVMPDSADDITTRTRYDSEGRVVESRMPKSAGGDAGTTYTVYYVAGTGSGDAACDAKPAWAGLVCRTYPAAAPDSGPALPDSRVTGYSYLLAPTVTTQASGGVTRTSTTSYLLDGRVDLSWTEVTGLASSTAVPVTKTTYDEATGLAVGTESRVGGTVTASITTAYDAWGRATGYTNSAGGTTTTTYDAAGRIGTVTDPLGNATTYGYDLDANDQVERRGLVTSLTVDGVGTFRAAYDADGAMVEQELPGGLSQTTEYDDGGEPVGLTYSGPVTDPETGTVATGPWLAWSQENDGSGRVAREWTPAGAAFTDGPAADNPGTDVGDALSYDRRYRYDRAARLVSVHDRTASVTGDAAPDDRLATPTAPCTVRDYTFDKNGNRTRLATNSAADGSCASGTADVATWTVDTADRVVGHSYDELGRTVLLPIAGSGNVGLGYYDTDAVRSITAGSETQTFSLDPAGRRLVATTGPAAGGTATRTVTRHYTDAGDNPGWVVETAGTTTTTTRYAESPGGDLGAIVSGGTVRLTLANLHGDVVSTVTLPSGGAAATGLDGWTDYLEYGAPRTVPAVADPLGYGWVGAKQRSTDTLGTGLVLMGARLYDPTSGRFTSVDPVAGGNENAYNYPNDPVNAFDLDGRWGWWKRHKKKIFGGLKVALGVAAMFTCTLCTVAAVAATAWTAYDTGRAYRRGGWRAASVEAVGLLPVGGRLASRGYGGWARAGIRRSYRNSTGSAVRSGYRRHLSRSYRMQSWGRMGGSSRYTRNATYQDYGGWTYDTLRYARNEW